MLRLSRARVHLGARDRVFTLLAPLSPITGYIAKVVDRATADGRIVARYYPGSVSLPNLYLIQWLPAALSSTVAPAAECGFVIPTWCVSKLGVSYFLMDFDFFIGNRTAAL